ncbi:MAG TPA: abortive infection family protein [Lacunisphaera sp.]|nr:abortive infection family protein [Lacunisphaera sp.]
MSVVPPLNDTLVYAFAQAVDDAPPAQTREPSHSDLDFIFQRSGVLEGDPKAKGQTVGKAKRVRAVLSWAVGQNIGAGRVCVSQLLAFLKAQGGFRPDAPNFIGAVAIKSLQSAFAAEGFMLTDDGELSAKVLDAMTGAELTAALAAYVRRAQRGAEDAALLTGTSKDLLEATAAHVLREVYNVQEPPHQFPMLLGQAFAALQLKTTADKESPGETPQHRLQRHLYGAACAINTLRNRQGSGHGRPWLPTVTEAEAHASIQTMGLVAQMLLTSLSARTK